VGAGLAALIGFFLSQYLQGRKRLQKDHDLSTSVMPKYELEGRGLQRQAVLVKEARA
jgi:hypothetical protein